METGERLNGIQEVSGSIPLISTTRKRKKLVLTKVKTSFFVFPLQIDISADCRACAIP